MSFFILDPSKNTVSDTIIPTGTSAANANIVIPTTVVIQNISTPNTIKETYVKLINLGTSYTVLSIDNTIEVASSTYISIVLPTSMNNPNKKYTIMRSFAGNSITTVYPYSLNETIDNYPNVEMAHGGDIVELISDGEGNWRTY